jgi:hypothetical protein
VSNQKDPLGNYHRPGVAKPETEIPPITEFPDGTPIDAVKRVMALDDVPTALQLPKPWGEMTPDEALAWQQEQARQFYYPDVEFGVLPADTEWLSLAQSEIPSAVKEYVKLIETGETTKWCKCPWGVHPDHVEIPADHCTVCLEPRNTKKHVAGPTLITSDDAALGFHYFKGRGIRRTDTNPICPVHTKEGLILGLFEHLFGDDDATPSDSGG